MTYQELEELGWKTIAKDTNSFVSRTSEEYVWLEAFYSSDTDYLQIMRAIKGNEGEILRHTIYEGKYYGIDIIKQLLK